MKKNTSVFTFSQILTLSATVVAIQNHRDKRSDDPFAQVFEGSGEDDDVISDTGQYRMVGNLYPRDLILPKPNLREVATVVPKEWRRNKEPVFNPWDAPKSRNWFQGGTQIPEVGLRKEKSIQSPASKTEIPVVGKSMNYVPPWLLDYSRNAIPNQGLLNDRNIKNPIESQLSVSNRDKNASYGEFPAIPLSFPPFRGNFQKPHNWNGSVVKSDVETNIDGADKNSEITLGSRVEENAGKMFFTPGSNFVLDIGRQNYWDPAFGFWPTHTVNPSNINVLEEAETPPGKACPYNWKHFGNSCYLLRNQELFPGELVTTLYKASWYTAKATCIALGGYLAEINEAEEQNFVQKMKIANHVALLWIGATDLGQDGYWTWSQSKKAVEEFTYWARPWRGPTGPVGRGHCLALRGDGKWDSFRCPNKFPYLCEKGAALISENTTPLSILTTSGPEMDVCTSVTLEDASWLKLSSKLLTHPPLGRCYVKIEFSTFSDGLILRKFDWNDESISLSINAGQLVLTMATGLGREASSSSPYIVNDGLLHTVVISFGVGLITLQVDDDLVRAVEDEQQPGLPQDANVFLGGEPGSRFNYPGFSGCIYSFNIFIAPSLNELPVWRKSLEFNFHQKDSLTVFYGKHTCGLCNMREMEENQDNNKPTISQVEDNNWEVDELPRPMTTWTPYQELTEKDPTPIVDDTVIIESKPLTVLDATTTRTMKMSTISSTHRTLKPFITTTISSTTSTTIATTTASSTTSTIRITTKTTTFITTRTTSTTSTTSTTTTTTTTTSTTTKSSTTQTQKTLPTTLPTQASTANEYVEPQIQKEPCQESQVYLDGNGWLELSRKVLPQKANMRTEITLRFATRENHALILWQGDYNTGHYFALALVRGRLEFRFNLGKGPAVIRSTQNVNSGREHEVVIMREDNKGSLQLDGGKVIEGYAQGAGLRLIVRRAPVFLGGAPISSDYLPPAKLYKTGFKGCILKMRVENKKVLEDDSGLGGFGADIDFTDNRLLKDWANSVRCLEKCFV